MQYGLSEKSAGAVKTVLAAAGVVLDALEKNIAVIKGDGIGPEIVGEAMKVFIC